MAEVRRRIDTRPFRDRLAGISLDRGYDEVNARLYEAGLGDGLRALTPAIAERTTERRRELGLADDGVRSTLQ